MQDQLSKIGNSITCPVIAIIKNNKILLGHRHYKTDKWKNISVWTLPGGRCDEGESIETTLRREVFEETGIKNLTIGNYLGEVPGAKEGDNVLVFAGTTNDESKLMEPEKFSEWSWFGLSEIPSDFINEKAKELILKSVVS